MAVALETCFPEVDCVADAATVWDGEVSGRQGEGCTASMTEEPEKYISARPSAEIPLFAG